MEICFENRYFATKEMLKEYVAQVICKKINICALILFVAGAALSLIRLFLSGDAVVAAIYGVCAIIGLGIFLLMVPLTLKEVTENDKALNGGTAKESIVQFGKNIKIIEGTFSVDVEYNQIFKVYELKYSFVLMFGKRNAVMIKKDAFTKGTFEEFKLFIAKECKNIK